MGDFSTATTTILPSHGRRRQSPEVSAVYRVGSFVLSKHAAISTRRSPLLLHAHKIVARDGGSKVYVSYSPTHLAARQEAPMDNRELGTHSQAFLA